VGRGIFHFDFNLPQPPSLPLKSLSVYLRLVPFAATAGAPLRLAEFLYSLPPPRSPHFFKPAVMIPLSPLVDPVPLCSFPTFPSFPLVIRLPPPLAHLRFFRSTPSPSPLFLGPSFCRPFFCKIPPQHLIPPPVPPAPGGFSNVNTFSFSTAFLGFPPLRPFGPVLCSINGASLLVVIASTGRDLPPSTFFFCVSWVFRTS